MDYQFMSFCLQKNNKGKIVCQYVSSALPPDQESKKRYLNGPFKYHFNEYRSEYRYLNMYYSEKDTLVIDVGNDNNCIINIINNTKEYLNVLINVRNGNLIRNINKTAKRVIIRL